jgi:hypothetical protein
MLEFVVDRESHILYYAADWKKQCQGQLQLPGWCRRSGTMSLQMLEALNSMFRRRFALQCLRRPLNSTASSQTVFGTNILTMWRHKTSMAPAFSHDNLIVHT